jgi:CubicO group peptidase (beta-lactamase class C family)
VSHRRIQILLGLVVAGLGLLLAAILGLFAYMSVTATPLHPSAQDVPAVTQSVPPPEWVGAVARGRQIARAGLTEQNLPGLSVAVGVSRDIVWAEGFGWADLETRVPVSPNHRFRIGTASTMLTAAAAGLLLEKGRLRLDDPIQTYVPEFPQQQWPVTLRQVMGHRGGLGSDGGDEGPLFSRRCERPVDGLQVVAGRSLLFEPGTQYRYSTYGWILVSAAIEAAAGEPFLMFMRDEIFDRLGMRGTSAESAAKEAADDATSYFPRFAADPRYGPDPMREIDLSCYAGAMAFLSTPSDLVRFGLAIDGGRLLQPATVQLLQSSQRLPSGQETGYGLGWDLETVTLAGEAARAIGHDGDVLGGMVASVMTFRERGLVVAVASNTSYADTSRLALNIANAFAEQQKAPSRK